MKIFPFLAHFLFEHRQNKCVYRIPDLVSIFTPKEAHRRIFVTTGSFFRATNGGKKQYFLASQACSQIQSFRKYMFIFVEIYLYTYIYNSVTCNVIVLVSFIFSFGFHLFYLLQLSSYFMFVTHRPILTSSLLPLHASSMRHRCCPSSFYHLSPKADAARALSILVYLVCD